MKNKTEITKKQLETLGNLITESEILISGMIDNGQSGPMDCDAKNLKGLCKKHNESYWWNDVLSVHRAANKASGLFAKLCERMNQNDA